MYGLCHLEGAFLTQCAIDYGKESTIYNIIATITCIDDNDDDDDDDGGGGEYVNNDNGPVNSLLFKFLFKFLLLNLP